MLTPNDIAEWPDENTEELDYDDLRGVLHQVLSIPDDELQEGDIRVRTIHAGVLMELDFAEPSAYYYEDGYRTQMHAGFAANVTDASEWESVESFLKHLLNRLDNQLFSSGWHSFAYVDAQSEGVKQWEDEFQRNGSVNPPDGDGFWWSELFGLPVKLDPSEYSNHFDVRLPAHIDRDEFNTRVLQSKVRAKPSRAMDGVSDAFNSHQTAVRDSGLVRFWLVL